MKSPKIRMINNVAMINFGDWESLLGRYDNLLMENFGLSDRAEDFEKAISLLKEHQEFYCHRQCYSGTEFMPEETKHTERCIKTREFLGKRDVGVDGKGES